MMHPIRVHSAMAVILIILAAIIWVPHWSDATESPSSAQQEADMPEGVEYIESEAGFFYTIKKGDTLWDLSQRFSDSPWQWPDLWKENEQIANPHWIYPGNRIRLFRKKDVQRMLTQIEEQAPGKEPPIFIYSSIDRVGFIRKTPVEPLGSIIEVRDRKTLIAQDDIVYIH